jgi:hypothetical protein
MCTTPDLFSGYQSIAITVFPLTLPGPGSENDSAITLHAKFKTLCFMPQKLGCFIFLVALKG